MKLLNLNNLALVLAGLALLLTGLSHCSTQLRIDDLEARLAAQQMEIPDMRHPPHRFDEREHR